MVYNTEKDVIDACNAFQGGFVKMWTRDEIVKMQEPYRKMNTDYELAKAFVKANTK